MKKFELTDEFVTNVFGKKLFRIKVSLLLATLRRENSADLLRRKIISHTPVMRGSAAMRVSAAMQTLPSLQALVDISARPHFSAARIKFSAYSAVAFMVI